MIRKAKRPEDDAPPLGDPEPEPGVPVEEPPPDDADEDEDETVSGRRTTLSGPHHR